MPVLFPQRLVVRRRLREFNACHIPAGEGGGQFAPKGQGQCDGATPDSATKHYGEHYGPKEPHDDPAHPETLSRDAVMALIPAPGEGPLPKFIRTELWNAAEQLQEDFLAHHGKDSREYHTDADGNYTPTRAALHKEILTRLFEDATPAAGQPTIMFMGGLPGSGKTYAVLSKMNTKGFVIINADDLKEALPEYNGNNAAFLHEESSDLKNAALQHAAQHGYSVIFDGTMSGEGSVTKTANLFKRHGYRVEGRLVDVPVAHSYKSAITRFYQGQVDYKKKGKAGIRGRFVPPHVITDAAHDHWGSKPRATFEKLKPEFDAWSITSGQSGKTLDSHGKLHERATPRTWAVRRRPTRLLQFASGPG